MTNDLSDDYEPPYRDRPIQAIPVPAPVCYHFAWILHLLSLLCLLSVAYLFLLNASLVPRYVHERIVDTFFGPGTARDAQGGAFAVIWLLAGSFALSLFFCLFGWGIAHYDEPPRPNLLKINLTIILLAFIAVLFSCFLS